ncbi:MAG: sugar ABC transporter ATP-binding protein [Verrucomicrobia bacterium]|nr:sugar ABC transporter ATP-binding protein [Verrucomicrobiota bacterium]
MSASEQKSTTGPLALRGITKSFPGVRAVDNVTVDFYPGKIHALMGENGAGKSTVMKIITGIYQPDSGEMSFHGERLAPRSYRESLAMGIDIVHQEIQVVPEASVAENIMLDKLSLVSPGGRVNWRRLYEEASVFMQEVGLHLPPSTVVRQLSAAYKQLIQIARALAARATVILLDEPTSSLSLSESDNLFNLLDGLKQRGVTVIYVSHKIEEVYRIADSISVMRDGKLIGTRPRAELERNELVRMMIGRDLREQRIGSTKVSESKVVLKVEALSKAGKCTDISFELREGEILGFYGLIGAGRTEFARVLIGEDQADSGSVYVNGQKATIRRVSDALFRYKIGYVTENRKEEGLFLGESVLTNLTLLVWKRMRHPLTRYISRKKEEVAARKMVSELSVRARSLADLAANLSGGNQQKISIGRWLLADCDILIIDEPTVGVDVGAKEQIHQLIWNLARLERKAIILISSEMAEIIRLSSRILVFANQQIIGEVGRLDDEERSYAKVRDEIGNLLSAIH